MEEEEEEEGDGGDVEATLRKKSSSAAVDERARVTSGGGGRRRLAVVAVLCRKRCSSIFVCAIWPTMLKADDEKEALGGLQSGLGYVCVLQDGSETRRRKGAREGVLGLEADSVCREERGK